MQVNHVENNSIGYWEHSVLVYEGTEIMFRQFTVMALQFCILAMFNIFQTQMMAAFSESVRKLAIIAWKGFSCFQPLFVRMNKERKGRSGQQRVLINIGISLERERGWAGQLQARSGKVEQMIMPIKVCGFHLQFTWLRDFVFLGLFGHNQGPLKKKKMKIFVSYLDSCYWSCSLT